eukprot:751897-Hanusia_phi.AAC.2
MVNKEEERRRGEELGFSLVSLHLPIGHQEHSPVHSSFSAGQFLGSCSVNCREGQGDSDGEVDVLDSSWRAEMREKEED